VIDQKVNSLSQMILQSKHAIFFTGAGISTSLGIPDYRSG
jgi:NAD-dependent SIR2 family protein deacetylase